MLDALIQSKTRLRLLLRFFLNPDSEAYLRGLAHEFGESTNAVRVELNRFEDAGLIVPHKEGNKKVFQVNSNHPMYSDLQRIAFKHFGLDQVVDNVISKLGNVQAVYLTGDLAQGLDTNVIDITLIGEIDATFMAQLVEKAEGLIKRKIRTLVYLPTEEIKLPDPKLLIFGDDFKLNENSNKKAVK